MQDKSMCYRVLDISWPPFIFFHGQYPGFLNMVMMTLKFNLEYLCTMLQCEEEQDNGTREWESTNKVQLQSGIFHKQHSYSYSSFPLSK